MTTTPQSRRHRWARSRASMWRAVAAAAVAVSTVGATELAAPPVPVAADAGSDLMLSAARGPVGTRVVLQSADVFDMGADLCPGINGERTWEDGDTFEVRWEIALLPDDVVGFEVAEGTDLRATTSDVEVVEVLDRGVVPTELDVPWSTTLVVPTGPEPGQRLVVKAACWHLGDDVTGGSEVWFSYYYVPVFTVTAPDGSVPGTTVTTAGAPVTAPRSDPEATPAVPAPAPAVPASPRRGTATFTG